MQNAAIAALSLDWRYLAFDVRPEELSRALEGAKTMGFIGLNLTVPHKLLALPLMDVLDASAQEWGAVNTVGFEGRTAAGAWVPLRDLALGEAAAIRARGFNTDAEALSRSLREDLGFTGPGRSVLLLGAGGAGRVAALRLAAEGVDTLYLVNRTPDRAAELARELRERHPGSKVILGYPTGSVDLVLNATSLGLKPGDRSPLDPQCFALGGAGAVYDMIYRPAETPLLHAARLAGRPAANGLGMLLYQGARALEIWTGQPAPLEVMRTSLEQAVYG